MEAKRGRDHGGWVGREGEEEGGGEMEGDGGGWRGKERKESWRGKERKE